MSTSTTIAELLRTKDLTMKKVTKDSTKFLATTTTVGNGMPPHEFTTAASSFQSVYDLLSSVSKLMSQLRRANVATLTEATDYFTDSPLSVVECRQNIVGDKNVGLPYG